MAQPNKILLIQLYSNGDCLYATTVAKQIKDDYPGCHLTWAIAPFCKTIIANNPYVDTVMEVNIRKDDVPAFRRFRSDMLEKKKQGLYDDVFVLQPIDRNLAFYDGSIRSNIFNAYPHPIRVPVTPVLHLSAEETNKTESFANQHELSSYKNILLFEYAPQSGQLKTTKEFAVSIAESITSNPHTAVILSSANKIQHPNKAIIDGSSLSLRETAALTHHCTMLLGCSSGITWITTSSAAKFLPMVQILNPYAEWVNPISRDFKRFHLPVEKVIELLEFDKEKIVRCVTDAMSDFESARKYFNQPVPLHFKTTRKIVYNLLCYLQLAAIMRHIKINRRTYGDNSLFYKELVVSVVSFPFKLLKNLINKHLFKRS